MSSYHLYHYWYINFIETYLRPTQRLGTWIERMSVDANPLLLNALVFWSLQCMICEMYLKSVRIISVFFCWIAKSRDTTFLGCKKEVYFQKWRLWKAKTSVRFASTCCTVYYTEAWRKVTLHCYNSFTIMCNSKNSFVSMQALHCRISACRLPINPSQ